jgi:putative oxidoreductase
MKFLSEKSPPLFDVAARLMLAAIFIAAGAGKVGSYEATQGYMEAAGVPGMLLPLVIATELGGGLALAIGLATRIAALALAGFTVVAAIIFHADLADQMQSVLFMKNIAITGGLLLLVRHGGGAWALENSFKTSHPAGRSTA